MTDDQLGYIAYAAAHPKDPESAGSHTPAGDEWYRPAFRGTETHKEWVQGAVAVKEALVREMMESTKGWIIIKDDERGELMDTWLVEYLPAAEDETP